MTVNFKKIHIGSLIFTRVNELKIAQSRIIKFFNCTDHEINEMYDSENIDVHNLLKWCKLLEYDFFRLYTQHLILYSPPSGSGKGKHSISNESLPVFRKNIYTKEIIDFMLELILSGEKTKSQIINEYGIPKTTLYKWISKYSYRHDIKPF